MNGDTIYLQVKAPGQIAFAKEIFGKCRSRFCAKIMHLAIRILLVQALALRQLEAPLPQARVSISSWQMTALH